MPSDGTDPLVALITLAQAKAMLHIATGTVADDAVIADMVNRASVLAASATGRKLVSAAFTEYYNGDFSDTLMLRNWPIITLTSLYDDPLHEFPSITQIDLTRDAIVDKEGAIVRLWNQRTRWLTGKGNIRAIYTAGFVSPGAGTSTVPYDLQEAVGLIVQHQYRRAYLDQRIGLQSETVGDRTFTYSEDAIPKKADMILKGYRSPPCPQFSHAA